MGRPVRPAQDRRDHRGNPEDDAPFDRGASYPDASRYRPTNGRSVLRAHHAPPTAVRAQAALRPPITGRPRAHQGRRPTRGAPGRDIDPHALAFRERDRRLQWPGERDAAPAAPLRQRQPVLLLHQRLHQLPHHRPGYRRRDLPDLRVHAPPRVVLADHLRGRPGPAWHPAAPRPPACTRAGGPHHPHPHHAGARTAPRRLRLAGQLRTAGPGGPVPDPWAAHDPRHDGCMVIPASCPTAVLLRHARAGHLALSPAGHPSPGTFEPMCPPSSRRRRPPRRGQKVSLLIACGCR